MPALRGTACLFVFVYHIVAYEVYRGFMGSHPVVYPFLFFVLSGFVLLIVAGLAIGLSVDLTLERPLLQLIRRRRPKVSITAKLEPRRTA